MKIPIFQDMTPLPQGITDIRVYIDFSGCNSGPMDMLDAFVAAATVREFLYGRGTEVDGGDGLSAGGADYSLLKTKAFLQ